MLLIVRGEKLENVVFVGVQAVSSRSAAASAAGDLGIDVANTRNTHAAAIFR